MADSFSIRVCIITSFPFDGQLDSIILRAKEDRLILLKVDPVFYSIDACQLNWLECTNINPRELSLRTKRASRPFQEISLPIRLSHTRRQLRRLASLIGSEKVRFAVCAEKQARLTAREAFAHWEKQKLSNHKDGSVQPSWGN